MITHTGGTGLERRSSDTSGPKWQTRLVPQAGDVLVSSRSARADIHTISIVSAAAHARVTRHAEAIEKVRALARGLGVDGWFTCDHTHYARVAKFRKALRPE